MKFYLFLLLISINSATQAEQNFPPLCKPLLVKEEALVIKTTKPLMILIHNVSTSDLWITHTVSEASANAGWSSRIETENWSALAVDKKSFEISCIESKPGHEQQVPCSGVIAVCEWEKMVMPKQKKGTFWAGENMNLPSLTAHLDERGFVLPKTS